MLDVTQLLDLAVRRRASDLHLIVGSPPYLRIDGQLLPVPEEAIISPEFMEKPPPLFCKAISMNGSKLIRI